jgi:O-antigen/teichoic acid export membrane protein
VSPTESPVAPVDARELRERALGGVLAVAVRGFAIRGMSLAASIVLARRLTPDDFGVMAIGLSVVAIGSFLASGGLGSALIRQHDEPTRAQLESVFGLQLAIALAAAALTAAIGVPLGTAGALAALMTLSLPIDVCRVPAAILSERDLRFGPVVRAEIGEMVAYNVVAIALVVAGLGVWGVGIAVLVRATAGSALMIAGSRGGLVRPRLRLPLVRPLLRFGLTLQSVSLVQMVRGQGINFTTAGIGGLAVLGQWNFSIRLLQPVTLLFDAVSRVAFPAVAGLLRTGEDPKPMIEKGFRLAYGLTALGVVCLAASAPAAVPSVFGAAWKPAVSVLPWSLAGLLVTGPVVACVTSYLTAIGDAREVLRSTILYSIAWILVTVPLLPVTGETAPAIGWTVAGVLNTWYLARVLRRTVPVRLAANAGLPVLLAVLVAPVGWLLEAELGATIWVAALSAAVAGLAYLALLRVLSARIATEMWQVAGRFLRYKPTVHGSR